MIFNLVKAGGIGGVSILRERHDFWEDTIYGHGGDAKIWAGLGHDHGKFRDGEVNELGPAARDLPLRALGTAEKSSEAKEVDEGQTVQERIDDLKDFCKTYLDDRFNVGYSPDSLEGRYIPTIFPADALEQFGRTFDDFKCCILDLGRVSSMAPKIGRIYKVRATVIGKFPKTIFQSYANQIFENQKKSEMVTAPTVLEPSRQKSCPMHSSVRVKQRFKIYSSLPCLKDALFLRTGGTISTSNILHLYSS